ncbi:interleukin-1 beta isoform X1 [Struthio camelus]|uniref:interleukin-1 beta isoform X1 n=1 Tax=Struthio camelus TaxID=8801 RepID=UPI0036042F7C
MKTRHAGAGLRERRGHAASSTGGASAPFGQVLQPVAEMAFVPDLDMLESNSLTEETFYGPDYVCLQKVDGDVGTWEQPQPEPGPTGVPSLGHGRKARLSYHIPISLQKPRLSSDLKSSGQSPSEVDVQVTITEGHPTKTFRQVAVLMVATTKLLKRPSHQDFADSDLGSFLDTVFEPVPFQRLESSYAGAPVYRYTRSLSFDILDINHKSFVLESPTQLVALHLQGPSASRKVKLNIALYRPKSSQGNPGAMQVPVALGIKGYKLYMSCVMSGAKPMLQLEEADITKDIDSFELTRFIFYRLDSPAEGTTRFESAAFPGWFVCTSLQSKQPVGITNQPDQVNITTYRLSRH